MEPILIISSALLWVMVVLNLLLTLGLARRIDARLPKMDFLQVGQPAPEFTAQTLEGKTVTLATYAQRTVVFLFISPDCRPCHEALPALEALRSKAEKLRIELVLVSDADATETQSLTDELAHDFVTLVAPRGSNSFFPDYKVLGTPFHCLVDDQGKVQATGLGWSDLGEKLEVFLG